MTEPEPEPEPETGQAETGDDDDVIMTSSTTNEVSPYYTNVCSCKFNRKTYLQAHPNHAHFI